MAGLGVPVLTRGELLVDLLAANEQLLWTLKLYDDLKRVALEREAEDRSRQEVRMDRREPQFITEDSTLLPGPMGMAGDSASRSPSPPPARMPVPVAVQPSSSLQPVSQPQAWKPQPTSVLESEPLSPEFMQDPPPAYY
ncbi:hypothetical protein B0H19DRAFT_1008224 [Mycena capillaripes]|nr:hypothetical protein B0H19DRAFT_1008224 [Mycena capillaripes]